MVPEEGAPEGIFAFIASIILGIIPNLFRANLDEVLADNEPDTA